MKLSPSSINFQSNPFSNFENKKTNVLYKPLPQNTYTLPKKTYTPVKQENTPPKKSWYSQLSFLDICLFTIGSCILLPHFIRGGYNKFMSIPSKKDIKLGKIIDKRAEEISQLTNKFKQDVIKLYEEKLAIFKGCVKKPDITYPEEVKKSCLNITKAKTIEELFDTEDKCFTSIYQWVKKTNAEQKPATHFVEPFNQLKDALSKGVNKLKQVVIEEINKPLDIPEKLRKTKHSKEMLKNYVEQNVDQKKNYLEHISERIEKIADEDTYDYVEKYNETFEKLVDNKNKILKQVIKSTQEMKDKLLFVGCSPVAKNLKNILPESIANNEFYKFINSTTQTPQNISKFIQNSMGKDLSYKDIDFLGKRLKLREDISVNSATVEKHNNSQNGILKMFKSLFDKETYQDITQNVTPTKYLEAKEILQMAKDKYGIYNFYQLVYDMKKSFHYDWHSIMSEIDNIVAQNKPKILKGTILERL